MTYYYETRNRRCVFTASTDGEALQMVPHGLLYRETDTPDVTPFVVLREEKEEPS